MNRFGYSSRLGYDDKYNEQEVVQSTSPMQYRLDTNQSYNNNQCFNSSGNGARIDYRGNGISLPMKTCANSSQAPEVVDIESILTNRNMKLSKLSKNGANKIDVTKVKLNNLPECNDYTNSSASRLTNPPQTYREIGINRFVNLVTNPQLPLFWDFAVSSRLEATDNYHGEIPESWVADASLPNINSPFPAQSCSTSYCPNM